MSEEGPEQGDGGVNALASGLGFGSRASLGHVIESLEEEIRGEERAENAREIRQSEATQVVESLGKFFDAGGRGTALKLMGEVREKGSGLAHPMEYG